MATPGQLNNSNDHAEKQFFKCTYPSAGGDPCGHVGTVGEYTEHFGLHSNVYRINCGSCGARFVEEAMFFDHIDISKKSSTAKKCLIENRQNINNDRDSVLLAYKNRNVHLQLVGREDFEEFQARKMNSSARKTPDGTGSLRSRSKSAASRRQSNGSTSSPESAADLRLGDARRTPGGFVSTETRPQSTEEDIQAAIHEEPARLPQESVPPLRHDHEPLRHFYNSYEAPIANGVPSESWRPPPVPVEFDPSRPPPPFGVQIPTQTFESRQPSRASAQQVGPDRVTKGAAAKDRPEQRDPTSRPNPVPLSSAFSALDLGHQDSEFGQRTGDFPIRLSDHSLRGPEDLKEEPTQEDQNTLPAQRASSPQPVPPPHAGQYSLNDLSVPWSTEAPCLGYHIKEESTEPSVSIGSSTRTSTTVQRRESAPAQNSSCCQDLHNQNAPKTIKRPVEPQAVRQIAEPPAATRPGPVENPKSSQQQTERRSHEEQDRAERRPDFLRAFRDLRSISNGSQLPTAFSTGPPASSLFLFPARVDQQPRPAPDEPRPEPITVRTDSQNELDENEIVHEDSAHDFEHDLGRDEPMDICGTDFETEGQQPAATIPQDAQTPPGSPEARDSEPEQTRLSGRPPASTGSRARRVRRDSDESYRPDSPVRRSRSAAKKKKRGPSKPRKGAKGRKASNRRRSKKDSESSEDSNMDDDDDAAPALARIRGAPSAPIQQNSVSELPDYESPSPEDAPAPAPPRRGRPPVRTTHGTKPVAKRTRPSEDSEDSVESYRPPPKTTRGRRRSSGARDYDYDPPYRPQVARGSARPTERRTRSQGAADETLELPRTTRARKSTSTVRKATTSALSKIRKEAMRQRTPEQVLRQRTPEPEISDHEERAPRDESVEGEDEYEEVAPVQQVPQNNGLGTREVKEEPREEPVQRRSRPEFRRPVGAARGSPDIEVISHVRNGRVLSLFSNPSTRESSLARPGNDQSNQPRPSASPAYPVDREFYDRTRMESRGPVFGQNQPRNPPRPPQEVRVPPRQPQSTYHQGPSQHRGPLLATRPHQPRDLPRPPQEVRVPPRQPQSASNQGLGQSRLPLLGTRPHQPRNRVPVANSSSHRPPVDTSGWVSSRIMRPNEFHRGATHTSYHPSNVRRTLSRGSSGDRSASGGRASSGERDEERRGEPRARAPAGGRAPYRPPSRGGEENREDTVAPRSFAPAGRAHVPPAQPPRQPPSRGQVMGRQERNRLDILRAEQIALQQVGQFARDYDQITANGDARVKAIKEEAAKKRTIMRQTKQ
ncbi:unnamed protein product [Caenorhabditis brenneri]